MVAKGDSELASAVELQAGPFAPVKKYYHSRCKINIIRLIIEYILIINFITDIQTNFIRDTQTLIPVFIINLVKLKPV
jgi:hypothetical protein